MPTKRSVFYSFHYDPDNWRASQVRNMGVLEGNQPARDNDWEEVKKGGDKAIQRWIDGQLKGRSCTVVLTGSETANRKWINYEIIKSWNDGKGVVALHINNLKDRYGLLSARGDNPLDYISFENGKKLSDVAKTYFVDSQDSKHVYQEIQDSLSHIIEEAIQIRNDN